MLLLFALIFIQDMLIKILMIYLVLLEHNFHKAFKRIPVMLVYLIMKNMKVLLTKMIKVHMFLKEINLMKLELMLGLLNGMQLEELEELELLLEKELKENLLLKD
jgi:multidrug transporter EmrE-like cation transporter